MTMAALKAHGRESLVTNNDCLMVMKRHSQ
jgi:hypothetical protein